MKLFLFLFFVLSKSYGVEISEKVKLSCVRETNKSDPKNLIESELDKTFKIFDKFSISESKNNQRTLNTNELNAQGVCHLSNDQLTCDYTSLDGSEFQVKINGLRSNNSIEYKGIVVKKSLLDRSRSISCLAY